MSDTFWTVGRVKRALILRKPDGTDDFLVVTENGWLSPCGLIGLAASPQPVFCRADQDDRASSSRADINGYDRRLWYRLHFQPCGFFIAACLGPRIGERLASDLIDQGIAAVLAAEGSVGRARLSKAIHQTISRWASEGEAALTPATRRWLEERLAS